MENKLPISRNSKFFSEDDFNLHQDLAFEFLHGDLNMKLVLFQVDRTRTEKDDIYAEVGKDEIKFLPPIEVNGLVIVAPAENKSYDLGYFRYLEPGNLMAHIFIKHLQELNVEIRVGDFIGYPENENKIRYYTVVNDGKIALDNKHMHLGYKPYYRTIICTPVQENEFRGI